MFYSHTFLARKGPLGTVWVAAHMQSRLKKSHYTSTDIPSTVGLFLPRYICVCVCVYDLKKRFHLKHIFLSIYFVSKCGLNFDSFYEVKKKVLA